VSDWARKIGRSSSLVSVKIPWAAISFKRGQEIRGNSGNLAEGHTGAGYTDEGESLGGQKSRGERENRRRRE